MIPRYVYKGWHKILQNHPVTASSLGATCTTEDAMSKTEDDSLTFGCNIIPQEEDVSKALGAAVHEKMNRAGRTFVAPMPGVFGKFKHRGRGIIPPAMSNKYTPACIIAPDVNVVKITLLHEGRRSSLRGPVHAKNFVEPGENRNSVYKHQIEKVAKATFAVG